MRKLLLLLFFLSLQKAFATRSVILIIADDLGTDYCGFYEDHKDTAGLPNIRRLLSKGVRFTNAMSNPVCSPTRAGILTGRYSFRTGVGDVIQGAGSAVLDTAEYTIPRLLKNFNSTIYTSNIGKWHLSLSSPNSNLLIPNLIGYDNYKGNFLGALSSYTNWTKVVNGVSTTCTNYATTETANDAIAWIKNIANYPFFLWLAFNAPHTPYHLPPAGLHSYTGLSGTPADINAQPKAYFKASLEALDHEIGRLFDSLVVYQRLDSTDIIFIGDNGNALRTAQISDASRAKGTIYQYGVHVPFIISGPSVVNPNRVSDALVNTTDLFATILELLGNTGWRNQIPSAIPVDSKSIVPVLKQQSSSIRPWAFTELFKTSPDSSEGKAIRNMDYKLLNFDYGHQEFYHLANDSSEQFNLLNTTLSGVDLINYNYLCQELSILVGSGNFCDSVVSIAKITEENNFELFPNPAKGKITIKLNKPMDHGEIEIFAVNGSLVKRAQLYKVESKIDVSDLPAGLYQLLIKSEHEHRVKKLQIIN